LVPPVGASSGQRPAASQAASRSRVESKGNWTRHCAFSASRSRAAGTRRLAAGSDPVDAEVGENPHWSCRLGLPAASGQRPAASSQPGGVTQSCRVQGESDLPLRILAEPLQGRRHEKAGCWLLAAGSRSTTDPVDSDSTVVGENPHWSCRLGLPAASGQQPARRRHAVVSRPRGIGPATAHSRRAAPRPQAREGWLLAAGCWQPKHHRPG